jgi:hypothetical protein
MFKEEIKELNPGRLINTKMNSETSEYYDGYYCGKIDELRESIIELKSIIQIIEFENFYDCK